MLLLVVLGVVFIVFTILRLSPTDPIRTVLGDMATEERRKCAGRKWGWNDLFFVQFYNYIKGIVTKFDFGVSYVNRHRSSTRSKTASHHVGACNLEYTSGRSHRNSAGIIRRCISMFD